MKNLSCLPELEPEPDVSTDPPSTGNPSKPSRPSTSRPSEPVYKRFKVATYNSPGTRPTGELADDMQRLADRNVVFIATQENPDNLPAQIKPSGWNYYRPAAARSAAVFWDPSKIDVESKGFFKTSSPGDPVARRGIVWVEFDGCRWGSTHLPAFKGSIAKNATEFRKQEDRCAEWISRKGNRVLLGDFNARPDSSWMATMRKKAKYHRPMTRSGPSNSWIDHVWAKNTMSRPEALGVMGNTTSDHKAVIVRVTVRTS